MDIFLHIPSELACNIAAFWLCVRSVVLLDGAYCNKASRVKLFRTVLSSNCCVLSPPPSLERFQLYLNWAELRSVRTRSVVISPNVDLSFLETYLQRYPHLIESVIVLEVCDHKDGFSRIMSIIAQNCMKLTSLVCKDCVLTESVHNVLISCTQLQEIRLIDCPDSTKYSNKSLDLLVPSKLKVVELVCGEKSAVSVLQHPLTSCTKISLSCAIELPIYKMIEHMGSYSSLEAVQFVDTDVLTDGMMVQIIALCPQLLQLQLLYCDALTDTTGVAIAERLTQLRELKLIGCEFTDVTLTALALHRKATLTSLNVGYCSRLTSTGHNTVLSQCGQLYTYGCSYVSHIDPTLLTNLTTLYLEDIRAIASLSILLSGCDTIQRLFLGLTATNGCQFNFTCLSVESLPNLIQLSVVTIFAKQAEPPTLQELRLIRPTLKINYNTGCFSKAYS